MENIGEDDLRLIEKKMEELWEKFELKELNIPRRIKRIIS